MHKGGVPCGYRGNTVGLPWEDAGDKGEDGMQDSKRLPMRKAEGGELA